MSTNQFANRDAHAMHTQVAQTYTEQCVAVWMLCTTVIKSTHSEFDARIISKQTQNARAIRDHNDVHVLVGPVVALRTYCT